MKRLNGLLALLCLAVPSSAFATDGSDDNHDQAPPGSIAHASAVVIDGNVLVSGDSQSMVYDVVDSGGRLYSVSVEAGTAA
jgi:hypothetical protein